MAVTSACGSSAASAGSRALPKSSRQVKAAARAASRRVAPALSQVLGDWGARIRPSSETFLTVTDPGSPILPVWFARTPASGLEHAARSKSRIRRPSTSGRSDLATSPPARYRSVEGSVHAGQSCATFAQGARGEPNLGNRGYDPWRHVMDRGGSCVAGIDHDSLTLHPLLLHQPI